jgi:hypothetical protein
MLTSDLFTLIFVWIDDFLKENPGLLHRPGPDPRLSDSELMTLMLMQGLTGELSDEAWLRRVGRDFKDGFPTLPDRSRYQRRRGILARALTGLALWIQTCLGEDPRTRIADSAPIPICRNVRGPRCRTFRRQASWGRCDSQQMWFYGLRLHLLVTKSGLPTAWAILTAKRHDRRGLDALLTGLKDVDVYGDAAYNVRPQDREQLLRRGITITAAPRRDMKEPFSKAKLRHLKHVRFRIEWTLGLLSRVCNIQRTLARVKHALYERVSFCLAAFNVGVWVNLLLNRPAYSLKSLAA